ncbi:MAG TPA: ATP synthase F0 subunit B [Gemmataceae bacterium]|nr:ATP synthase F0 subunit B [Gemmataceae bacterium]
MRRIMWCLPFLFIVAALGCSGEEKHSDSTKYKVTLHKPEGKDKEITLDVANAEDRAKLEDHLKKGNVEEMVQEVELSAPMIFGIERWDLGIWALVIFVLVYLGLTRFAWKPMLQGFIDREGRIRSAQEQAEITRQEAMNLQAQLDAKWKEVGGEIAAAMDDARRERDAMKEQIVSKAKAEIQSERDRLQREMETRKDQVLKDLYEQSVNLATVLSSKVIGKQLSPEDHHRLLDETLTELKQQGTVGKA